MHSVRRVGTYLARTYSTEGGSLISDYERDVHRTEQIKPKFART